MFGGGAPLRFEGSRSAHLAREGAAAEEINKQSDILQDKLILVFIGFADGRNFFFFFIQMHEGLYGFG